jgi:hypothetical protein
VSAGLERLVNHCLEKNPEARFHSARDAAFALESLSGSGPTSAHAAIPTYFTSGQASMICCTVHSAVGLAVALKWITCLLLAEQQAVQNIDSHRRYCEEIHGYNLIWLILQKGLPRL